MPKIIFEHCIKNNSPLDFVSRHCYTANHSTGRGHYVYHALNEPIYMIDELKGTREIMDDYLLTNSMPL